MRDLLGAIFILAGALWIWIAAVGVLRMPDVFLRLSVVCKAPTLGLGLVLGGAALHFWSAGASVRALAVILFLFLTTPVAAHMLSRAAYFSGAKLWERTAMDELKGQYDAKTHALRGRRR